MIAVISSWSYRGRRPSVVNRLSMRSLRRGAGRHHVDPPPIRMTKFTSAFPEDDRGSRAEQARHAVRVKYAQGVVDLLPTISV
jgi:hypothetical protein